MRFREETVTAAGCDWEDAHKRNHDLDRLAAQRVEVLPRTDAIVRSKIAWKFSDLRQSYTYRLVDLAESTIDQWEQGNILACVILGRALVETVAVLHWVCKTMNSGLLAGDLKALDALAMQALFAGKREDWKLEGQVEAINVLAALNHLDKEVPGAKNFYLGLSEIAHPNSQGIQQFYSSLDKERIEVTYSRLKRSRKDIFHHLMAALFALPWALSRLREIDAMIDQVADLQNP